MIGTVSVVKILYDKYTYIARSVGSVVFAQILLHNIVSTATCSTALKSLIGLLYKPGALPLANSTIDQRTSISSTDSSCSQLIVLKL